MPFTKSLKSLSRKMDGRLLTIHTLYRQELSNFTSTWLGAEKVVVAEKDGQKIAVEIKSFIGPSKISQFYTALGQFISYRAALQQQETDRILYLAVPSNVYDSFFTMGFIQSLVQQIQIHLMIYDIEQEAIAQWQM